MAIVGMIVTALVTAAISYTIGLVVSAITGGPKTPSSTDANAFDVRAALSTTFDPTAPLPGFFGRRRVAGTVIFAQKAGSTTHIVYLIAGDRVERFHGIYLDNVPAHRNQIGQVVSAPWGVCNTSPTVAGLVTVDSVANKLTAQTTTTASTSIVIRLYDGTHTTADPVLLAAFPSLTSAHVGKGLCFAIVSVTPVPTETYALAFQKGMPDITFDVSGLICYDPRNPGHDINNKATWLTTSENPVIQSGNYVAHDLGMRFPINERFDWAACIPEANVCDQTVGSLSGPEKRYVSVAYWKTMTAHESIIKEIGATCAGGLITSVGKFKAWVGYYQGANPRVVTEEDYLDDGISFDEVVSIASKINVITIKFSSPADNWEVRDAPSYSIAADVLADGGEVTGDITLGFVPSASQAQRLAKISYMSNRHGAAAMLTTRIDCLENVSGDIISITDPLAGWNNKTFRVLSDAISTEKVLNFELRAEDASLYDWDYTTEEQSYITTTSEVISPTKLPAPGVVFNLQQVIVTGPIVTSGLMGSPDFVANKVEIIFTQTIYGTGLNPTQTSVISSGQYVISGASLIVNLPTFAFDENTYYDIKASFVNTGVEVGIQTITPAIQSGTITIPPSPVVIGTMPPLSPDSAILLMTIKAVSDPSVAFLDIYTSDEAIGYRAQSDASLSISNIPPRAEFFARVANASQVVAVPVGFAYVLSRTANGKTSSLSGPAIWNGK